MSAITITREQIYKRVWAEPATKVALAFGLSSVAVKKMCKRMNVPTPTRGYWARLAAGQKVAKTPLPMKHTDSTMIETKQIDAEANALRREALQKGLPTPPMPSHNENRLELPASLPIAQLHPRARAFHAALMKGKPDDHGIVQLDSPEFPSTKVSQTNAERTTRALHVIYSELESRGVELKPIQHYNNTRLGFAHGPDSVGILIEEHVEKIRRKPTPEELRRPSREWQSLESYQPNGLLQFVARENHGTWSSRQLFRRNEGPNRPIEELLHETVERIWNYFTSQDERRERERIEKEAREKAEAARLADEKERRKRVAERRAEEKRLREEAERQECHRKKLESLAAARVENLLRAAEWWRLQQLSLDYVSACERRWAGTSTTSKALSKAQQKWLAWARSEIQAMALGTSGYPDCEQDGRLDAASIPVGGPYPEQHEVPLPPTFWPPKEIAEEPRKRASKRKSAPAPKPHEESHPRPAYTPPSQFPFWLLHRNRR